jgi:plasmid maintenance system antidote protein VapI
MVKKIPMAFPVSSFIFEEMEARGWSKEYLLGKKGIRKGILKGSKITRRDAKALSAVFGTSEDYWLNIQKIWFNTLSLILEDEVIFK